MKKIITIAFILFFLQITFAQNLSVKDTLINYFTNNYEKLDPVEGIWILNSETTLYEGDSIIAYQSFEFLSEWAIVKDKNIRYSVVDIGAGQEGEGASTFNAFFEKTAVKGLYTYECHFKNPDWVGKSSAHLTNKAILDFGYYMSDAYMKQKYKNYRERNLKQYWKFTWIKKYPVEEIIEENYYTDWKGGGSGFFIDKRGYIATNYHVVVDANEIEIEFTKNDTLYKFNAEVIKTDKENDLAILKIKDPKPLPFYSLPYKIKMTPVRIGTKVFALGYPLTSILGNEIKFTDGSISSASGYKGDKTSYQTTTPIQPGNSGSPLFDLEGNIVGINSAFIKPEYADNIAYSIKTQYLQKLANEIPDNVSLQNQNRLENKSLIEKIQTVKDYVVLIRVK